MLPILSRNSSKFARDSQFSLLHLLGEVGDVFVAGLPLQGRVQGANLEAGSYN